MVTEELDAVVDDGYAAVDEIPKEMQLEQTENDAENDATAEDLPYTAAQFLHAENEVPHTEPASSHLKADHSQVQTSPRKDVMAEAHDAIHQKVDTTASTDTLTDTLITFTPLPVEAVDSEQVPEANWAPWDEDDDATARPVTVPTEHGGDSEAPAAADAAPKTSPPPWRKRRGNEAWDPAEDSSGEEARLGVGMRF